MADSEGKIQSSSDDKMGDNNKPNSRAHPAQPPTLNHGAAASTRSTSTYNIDSSTSNGLPSPIQPSPYPPPHGYSDFLPAVPDASKIDPESQIDPELRTNAGYVSAVNMIPAGVSSEQSGASAGPSSSPSTGPVLTGLASLKAKRELSQSKRAAQNRAAQRAFRQRKEGYIKKLEQQVREYGEMENGYKAMQAENYALREYVIHLQSRLLDIQGEYPQPPPNVNLAHPRATPQHAAGSSSGADSAAAPGAAAAGTTTSLEAVAQAVAGLARGGHLNDAQYTPKSFKADRDEDARTAERVPRQLNPDGIPSAPM